MATFDTSELIEVFFTISRHMRESMSYNSAITHLSMLQLQALIFIKKRQNARMREIAQQFKIEMPTATSLVEKLCKVGLVKRQEDIKDRRLVRILLTQNGENLLEIAMKERVEKIKNILTFLTEEDKEDLLRILRMWVKRMEGIHEK